MMCSSSKQASPRAVPKLQHPGVLQQHHLLPQCKLQKETLSSLGTTTLQQHFQSFAEALAALPAPGAGGCRAPSSTQDASPSRTGSLHQHERMLPPCQGKQRRDQTIT